MKKLRVFLLLVAVVAFLGVAHAQEIVLMHDRGGAAGYQPAFEKMAEYCQKELGITFTSISYAVPDVYMSAVRTALYTEEAPNFFAWWSDFRMKPLVDRDLLQDVTEIWDKRADEYDSGYRVAFEFNGRVYALPLTLDYWPIYYKKSIFEKFGLTEPTTWEEFIEICDVLKANNIIPLGAGVKRRWPSFIYFDELVIRIDPDWYEDLVVGKAKYTDETARKVFSLWKEMIEKGYFSDPGTDITGDYPRMMAQEKGAMIAVGTWYAGGQLKSVGLQEDKDIGAFIMPPVNPKVGNVVTVECAPLLIGKNALRKEDTLKIADWWMSPETQHKWCKLLELTPSNKKTPVDFLSSTRRKILKQISEGNYRLVNRYWEATPTGICEEAIDLFAEFMINPDRMEQVMQDLQEVADEYWGTQ